jgi:hypothetical protein
VNFADPKHSEEIRPSIGGVALAGTIVVPGDSQKRLTLPEQAGAGSGGHPPVLGTGTPSAAAGHARDWLTPPDMMLWWTCPLAPDASTRGLASNVARSPRSAHRSPGRPGALLRPALWGSITWVESCRVFGMIVSVLLSIVYAFVRAVFRLVVLRGRGDTAKEVALLVLRLREILDVTTVDWGVEVTLVELKDIQLPDSMQRAMARQAEAEREKRAKIINAEGESLAAAGVVEPRKVTRSALQNAASIAALFLTTEAVVADKPEKAGAAAGGAPDMGGMDF